MCKYKYGHFCAICNEGLLFLNLLQNVYIYLLACRSREVVEMQSDCHRFRVMGKGWIHGYAELDLCYP